MMSPASHRRQLTLAAITGFLVDDSEYQPRIAGRQ